VVHTLKLYAVVAFLAANCASGAHRESPPAATPVALAPDTVWLIFVDDLHLDFRKTGRLRSLLTVISTELIEHVRDWKKVISNIKKVCRQNGIMLLTTRSFGFPYHAYPDDFWRFELADLADIFSDCTIEKLEKDRIGPGVFIKARKPNDFVEKNLSDHELYSIIVDKRVKEIDQASFTRFQEKYRRRLIRRRLERSIKQFVSKITAVRSRRSGSPMTN